MPGPAHGDLDIGVNIHSPVRWQHADVSARTSQSVTTDDIGKLSWQQDDDSIWILTNTTPTWVSVSGQNASSLTVQNLFVTGDLDITGSIVDCGNITCEDITCDDCTVNVNLDVTGTSILRDEVTLPDNINIVLGDGQDGFIYSDGDRVVINNNSSNPIRVDGDTEFLADIIGSSISAYYLGDITTDGSWRMVRSGNDLVFQRRESSVWVTKSTISA